jgi:phosphatidylinositol glycan class B
MAFCVFADTTFYATFSFTPYTFLVQNVFNSISLFYGANPFHFYLTQALPFTTMTLLPFVLHGLYTGSKDAKPRLAATVALATIATYSLLGHKEFRFIYPIIPILHCFAASSLVSLSDPSPATAPARPSSFSAFSIRPSHAALVLASLGPALYLTAFHSLAQVKVMDTLRSIPITELRSVGFLVPCHSTPWQSHLHRRDLELDAGGSGDGGRAWFLSCEPPVL